MFNDFATQVVFTAIIYFAGLVELGAPWWKSFIISILVFVCCEARTTMDYARRGRTCFSGQRRMARCTPSASYMQSAFSPPRTQVNTGATAVSANPNTQ
jgi:hypothetical protein